MSSKSCRWVKAIWRFSHKIHKYLFITYKIYKCYISTLRGLLWSSTTSWSEMMKSWDAMTNLHVGVLSFNITLDSKSIIQLAIVWETKVFWYKKEIALQKVTSTEFVWNKEMIIQFCPGCGFWLAENIFVKTFFSLKCMSSWELLKATFLWLYGKLCKIWLKSCSGWRQFNEMCYISPEQFYSRSKMEDFPSEFTAKFTSLCLRIVTPFDCQCQFTLRSVDKGCQITVK